jgi:hypothetical protein
MKTILRRLYNATIRTHLPAKIGEYNNVAVRFPKLFDATDRFPEWKGGTVGAVRDHVENEETVVEIGTGFGVCSVAAARQGGVVNTYEASRNRYSTASETISMNGVERSVTLSHAIVSTEGEIFGETHGCDVINTDELPEHDVLLSDCEEAELDILRQMDELPKKCIIETHGFAGSPTLEVAQALVNGGHSIKLIITPASKNADPEEDNQVVVSYESSTA